MSSKKLIVFSAPSGAGKTTLVKYLLSEFNNIEFSISATSRKIRGNEKDGKDYYFLTEDEFRKELKRKNLLNMKKFMEVTFMEHLNQN
jgi:guanylate kinase